MVSVPMYLKKSVGRTIVQHPARVASIMIRNELIELGILGSNAESPTAVQDFLKSDEELGDLYERHCITVEALRVSNENTLCHYPCTLTESSIPRMRISWDSMSPIYVQKNKGWSGC